jgi:CheY-like chemotaxis protein
MARVFDLFSQSARSLDRSKGGLGIGLTLVRTLVEMHGGTVSARSGGIGQGSEFTVRLPLSTVVAEKGSPSIAPQDTKSANSTRRILIVDDNQDSAESMALLLKFDGHQVEMAHDGLTALRVAESFQPEIILLDIGLPGMNGYDVARQIRTQPETSRAQLIALTGYGQEEDRQRSKEAGFDYHLVKPVEPRVLQHLLNSIPAAAPSQMAEGSKP